MPDTEARIERLSAEVDSLRRSKHDANNALTAVNLGMAEIKLSLALQDKEQAGIRESVRKIDSAVNGNGRPGLCDLVADQDKRVDRLETTVGGWQKNVAAVVKALIGLIVTAGGAGALWVVTAMHK